MNRETKTIKSVYRRPTIEVVGVQCLAQLLQVSNREDYVPTDEDPFGDDSEEEGEE